MSSSSVDPRQGKRYNCPNREDDGVVVDPAFSFQVRCALNSASCYSPAVEREMEQRLGMKPVEVVANETDLAALVGDDEDYDPEADPDNI